MIIYKNLRSKKGFTTHHSAHGFTLIELLITLSIIAIITAIGIMSYQVILKNARDTKRQSDLSGIQSALEQYRADNGHYPLSGTDTINCPADKFILSCPLKATDKIYLNKIPNDPLGSVSQPYVYKPYDPVNDDCSADDKKCIRYCLFAKMENSGNIGGGSGQTVPALCRTSTGDNNFIMVLP